MFVEMKDNYTLDLGKLHELAKTDLVGLFSAIEVRGDWSLIKIEGRTIGASTNGGHDVVIIFGDWSIQIIHCINDRTASIEYMAQTSEFKKCITLGIYQIAK